MDKKHCITIVERSRVSPPPPPPGTIGHRSVPLTFFDIKWLPFPPLHHVFFYHFPHSKSHFMETVVPNLKHSLSITLQHYFPFVGNLVVFPGSPVTRKPEIRHGDGDYVVLTFAECTTLDFNYLAENHPRKSENFYPLVPKLGNAVKGPDHVTIPLFALQVTHFPDAGIAIGMTNHHSLGDASTRFSFLKAWSLVSESGGDHSFLTSGSPPIFDRLIDLPKLAENMLNQMNLETFYQTPTGVVFSSDWVLATFVLARTHISGLKKHVLAQLPTLEYVSSFTVTCGYVWSCIAKSFVKIGEEKGEDELEQFVLAIDCRSRLDPPLPTTYFGNCIATCIVTIRNHVLCGENGFISAAKVIGEGINRMVNNKEGILKESERWHDGFENPARVTAVVGAPKLDFYSMDFGWGKPVKYEQVRVCYRPTQLFSLRGSKESAGQDFEIGIYFPSMQMEAFSNIFNDGLQSVIAP